MPPQTGKSSLVVRLGQRGKQAHNKHRGDETTFGIINLPPGIGGGIAQLVTAKWAEYAQDMQNKDLAGQPYVLLRGIAVEPLEHAGVRVRGQGVMITMPLCDQKSKSRPAMRSDGPEHRTFEDNYADLLNEFRRFGIETDGVEFEDIESLLTALQEEKPYYRFSTRGWTPPATPAKPKPTEMVFTQFDGRCDYDGAGAAATVGAGTVDRTSAPPRNGSATAAHAEETTAAATTSADADEGDGSEQGFDEFGDLDSLVQRATAKDAGAQNELQEMAIAAGVEQAAVDGAESWEEVKELIVAARTGGGEEPAAAEEGPEEEEWEPTVGDVYLYKPLDPKTKKPVKKALEVEVLTVDKKTRTCDLMNLDAGRDKKDMPKLKYPKVKWDALESAE